MLYNGAISALCAMHIDKFVSRLRFYYTLENSRFYHGLGNNIGKYSKQMYMGLATLQPIIQIYHLGQTINVTIFVKEFV